MKQIIPAIIFLVILAGGFCPADNNVRAADPNSAEKTCGKVAQTEEPLSQRLTEILAALGKQTSEISSYQGRIEYLFIQEPNILD